MMGWYGDGSWMVGGWLWMAVLWVALIALVVWGVSALWEPRGVAEAPLDILRRRYAAGELTDAEFEQARRRLA